MRYGFVKAAAIAPKIRVADTEYNAQEIIQPINPSPLEDPDNASLLLVRP